MWLEVVMLVHTAIYHVRTHPPNTTAIPNSLKYPKKIILSLHTNRDSSFKLQLNIHSLTRERKENLQTLQWRYRFFLRGKDTTRYDVTATLTVAVRDKFIVGLVMRQVNVYVTVNWWAHATISTKWRLLIKIVTSTMSSDTQTLLD